MKKGDDMKIASYLTGSMAILLALYGIFFNRRPFINILMLVFFGLTWWLKNRGDI